MSDPYQKCITCNRQRACLLHKRAEFPPRKAKEWLIKTCRDPLAPLCCVIQYRAGIELAEPLRMRREG
jgi:hypothetical protein